VVLASGCAVRQGVVPGLPLAEARALLERGSSREARCVPHFEQHDPAADLDQLRELAASCQRYSPLVGLEEDPEPQSLLFDVTGCAHLFGGEEKLARQIVRDFGKSGLVACMALADTVGAAWGVAHFEKHFLQAAARITGAVSELLPVVVPPGRQQAALHPLPIAALRLPAAVVETLQELDLGTIGRLRALPRDTLAPRFGAGVARRFDQAGGFIPEVIVPVRPAEPVSAEWSFSEPVSDRHALAAILRILLDQLATVLVARQQGIQRLECRLLCTGRRSIDLVVGSLRPQAAAAHLEELLNLRLERTALPGEVLRIQMQATSLGPIEFHQESLFEEIEKTGQHDAERELATLLDRLSHRLGTRRVLKARLVPDPQPECASRWEPVLQAGEKPPARKAAAIAKDSAAGQPGNLPAAARPLWLSPQPEPIAVVSLVPDGPPIRFSWDGHDQVVRHFWGPERIETGWWRGPQVGRDYYRVETATGQRFWLFRRQNEGTWFLHGVFE